MKILSKLGMSVAVSLLAAACSSNNSPASTGSTTGSTSGAGTGSTSGAGTGSASGAGTGTSTGATTGTTSGATTGTTSGVSSGVSTGSTSGATSGTIEAGSPEASTEASTTEEASVEAAAPDAAASAASLVTTCNANPPSVYHTSATGTAFAPEDFCTLFISICSTKILAANTAFGVQSTCETAYENLTGAQQSCRTDHLCNAAAGTTSEDPHCYHAQGWNSATMQTGGPCN